MPERENKAAPPPPAKKKARKPRRPLKQTLRLVFVRIYTFALLSVIAVVCFWAIVYLFKFVFTPAKLPQQFAQWQGRLDPAALRQANVPGVTGEAGRAPMSHYHKVDRWFQADPKNGCTVSGCHRPLPHDGKSKIAAFPNLHVTFLDCTVCHEKREGESAIGAKWVSTVNGQDQDVPAVLRLGGLLETLGKTRQDAEKAQPRIAALLRESIASIGSGSSPELEDLLIEIESTVPDSPVWRLAVKHLAIELPLHARGEYSAKIVRKMPATDALKVAAMTRTFLATQGAERKAVQDRIHVTIEAKPKGCSMCHVKEGPMLDFAALGYSPQRAETLQALPLARMVERIREGESFQLPRVMEGSE